MKDKSPPPFIGSRLFFVRPGCLSRDGLRERFDDDQEAEGAGRLDAQQEAHVEAPPVRPRRPSAIVPAESVEFIPPPLGWLGGCSSVVGCTVTVHGGDPAPEAVHVPASLMGP